MVVCNTTGVSNISTDKVSLSLQEVSEYGYLTFNNGKVIKSDSPSDENIFLKGLDGEDNEVYRQGKLSVGNKRVGITYRNVKDTEENPLLIVVCNTIEFYSKVQTDLRVFVDGDKIYAMLVSGACCFDGVEFVRCSNVNLAGKEKIKYDAKRMQSVLSWVFKDVKVGYDLSKDIIANLVIEHEDNNNYKAGRANDDIYFFNRKNYDEEINRFNKKKALEEQKAKEHSEYLRQASERMREERLKAEAEEAKVKKEKRKETFEKVNLGAEDFLRIVSEMSKK